jgi:hypothetical protein
VLSADNHELKLLIIRRYIQLNIRLSQTSLSLENNASHFAEKNGRWAVWMIILGSLRCEANPCYRHTNSLCHDLEEPIEKRREDPAATICDQYGICMPITGLSQGKKVSADTDSASIQRNVTRVSRESPDGQHDYY